MDCTERIIDLRERGFTFSHIGREVGLTRQRVYQIVKEHQQKKLGILKPKWRKKERNAQILSRRRDGRKIPEIAQEFGLSPGQVYKILRKERLGSL